MTKKIPQLDQDEMANLFKRTEPKPVEEGGKDRQKVRTVGMKTSEFKRIDEIAQELGVKPHALMVFAIRDFIRRYDSGERPKTSTKTTLEL